MGSPKGHRPKHGEDPATDDPRATVSGNLEKDLPALGRVLLVKRRTQTPYPSRQNDWDVETKQTPFCPPRAAAPLRPLAAAAPGRGMQRGGGRRGWGRRLGQLQLWQDTLQLVQGGSGPRPQAVQVRDAGAMTDVSTPSA